MSAFARQLKISSTFPPRPRGYDRIGLDFNIRPSSIASAASSRHVRLKSSQASSSRPFSSSPTTMAAFPTPSRDPPKHEMAYFHQITSTLPTKNSEFRRVLWTGLYSQLVLMNIPVGGDIGDEVSSSLEAHGIYSLVERCI